jgi:hypothetical protein
MGSPRHVDEGPPGSSANERDAPSSGPRLAVSQCTPAAKLLGIGRLTSGFPPSPLRRSDASSGD